jgi:hypothetical protein
MTKTQTTKAAIPNPALTPLKALIGEWNAVGSHQLLPGETLHGRSTFSWMEGGAFLIWRSRVDKEGFPEGIAIIGSDDASGELFMLYFDERKVSRKYDVSVEGNVIKWWRNAPNFSQRYSWTFTENGDTIVGKGELCKDGSTWEKDLDLTYTRIK